MIPTKYQILTTRHFETFALTANRDFGAVVTDAGAGLLFAAQKRKFILE
jgi:hypothetical protein